MMTYHALDASSPFSSSSGGLASCNRKIVLAPTCTCVMVLSLHASCAVGYRACLLPIISHLEPPFQPAARVLSSLAIVTMRQKYGKAALTQPLVLARRDKLIKHNLWRHLISSTENETQGKEKQLKVLMHTNTWTHTVMDGGCKLLILSCQSFF